MLGTLVTALSFQEPSGSFLSIASNYDFIVRPDTDSALAFNGTMSVVVAVALWS